METIKRSQVSGLDPLSVAAALGYAREDVRGVTIEPDEVLVAVEDKDGQALQQVHRIVEG